MSSPMRLARWSVLLALLAAAAPARAVDGRSFLGEDNGLFSFRWQPAVALGDLSWQVDQLSLGGVSGDMRLALGNSNFSLGIEVDWQEFSGGTPYTNVYATSPMLTFHGYLTRSSVQPYLGGGAGTVFTEVVRGGGTTKNWYFCADPQVGVLITIVPELALDIRAHFEWTTAKSGAGKNFQWAGVGIGFALY